MELVCKKYKRKYTYIKIDKIPSNFRCYPIKKLLIRGFNYQEFLEIKEISINNDIFTNLIKLVKIYKDIIYNDEIKAEELEIIDFVYLMNYSFILTRIKKEWEFSQKCDNIYLKNNKEINCNHNITGKITPKKLEDSLLHKKTDNYKSLPFKVLNTTLQIHPIKIKDVFYVKQVLQESKVKYQEDILYLASRVSCANKKNNELYNILKAITNFEEINILLKKLELKNNIFNISCPKCNKNYLLQMYLDSLFLYQK